MAIMVLTPLEKTALDIRHKLVKDLRLMNIEGLAAIVTPSPELYEASMSAAREKHDERRAARHARVKHDVRRPLRNDNRIVMLSDLL